jgi:hypothetical protein
MRGVVDYKAQASNNRDDLVWGALVSQLVEKVEQMRSITCTIEVKENKP